MSVAFLMFAYSFPLNLSGEVVTVWDMFDVTSQKLSSAACESLVSGVKGELLLKVRKILYETLLLKEVTPKVLEYLLKQPTTKLQLESLSPEVQQAMVVDALSRLNNEQWRHLGHRVAPQELNLKAQEALLTIPEICEVFVNMPGEALTPTDRTLQLLIKAFNELQKLESGKTIINKLYALIIERNVKIKIKESNASISADLERNGTPYIQGVHDLENNQECCLLGALNKKADKYQVGLGKIPPHIMLGHELLHLIDGLQHPYAFINGTRTVQDWINDNQDNKQILTILQDSYFKNIFLSSKSNIYEELYVYFGTNDSRREGISPENHLLLEAGIGLKIGYSPTNGSFFINKQLGDALLNFYNVSFETYRPPSELRFDPNAALRSPSCFRTIGIGKTNELVEQLSKVIDEWPLFSIPSLKLGVKMKEKMAFKKLKDEKEAFKEAYRRMALAIDKKRFSLPLPIFSETGYHLSLLLWIKGLL
ncbi:MAG: hypothetical protein LBE99_00925 [Puniceicoccales bacterium]|nr:hypothetical protein [Puniceicoccales bacterium]